MMTIIMGFVFFLIGLTLPFLLSAQTLNQSGFISLDCGSPEGTRYVEDSNISYVSDVPYITSGVSASIGARIGRQGPYPVHFRTLRSFPQGIRNCYNVSIVKSTKYLIRASFVYENYDGLKSPPAFDIYVGNSFWETVNLTYIQMEHFIDLIHITSSNELHICLINTGNGVPLISSLEFRPLLNISYKTKSGSLLLHSRFDFGPTDYKEYRYPFDAYDRIWSTFRYDSETTVTTDISVGTIGQNNYQVPFIVMRTASTVKEIVLYTKNSSQYYIYMHFAEVVELKPNQSRVFNITHNGNLFYEHLSPSYLLSLTVSNEDPLDASDRQLFSFVSTENANLPPIINAFEMFFRLDLKLMNREEQLAFLICLNQRSSNMFTCQTTLIVQITPRV